MGHRSAHPVHHAGRAGRRGNLARVEHIERQGVIGLVAGPVRYRRARLQAQFFRDVFFQAALFGKGGDDFRKEGLRKAKGIQQFLRRSILLEIPENPFREPAHGGAGLAGHFRCHPIARQQDAINLREHFGLVLLDPGQFGGRKIARAVQQVLQAPFRSQLFKGAVAVGNGAGIAPDDGGPQRIQVLIYAHQAMHLVGDADGTHRLPLAFVQAGRGCFQVGPPIFGPLLGKAGSGSGDRGLRVGVGGRIQADSAFGIHQGRLDGRTANIVS